MKTIFILLFAMLVSLFSLAQEQKKVKEIDAIKVTPPQFTGISDAATIYQNKNFTSFEDYLRKNLKYPETVHKNGVNGTEVVRFEVSADGKLTDFEVINSVSPEIDEAIYEMLKTTCGMWKPGESNGEPVPMHKEISIAFKWKEFEELRETKDFDALAQHYIKKGVKQLLENNNPQKAMKHFNHAAKYRPNEDCMLMARGLCKFELGDQEGAQQDWDRMAMAGIDNEAKKISNDFHKLKGFSELAVLIEK